MAAITRNLKYYLHSMSYEALYERTGLNFDAHMQGNEQAKMAAMG